MPAPATPVACHWADRGQTARAAMLPPGAAGDLYARDPSADMTTTADTLTLVPGDVTRGQLRDIYRSRRLVRLDPGWTAKVEAGARIVAEAARGAAAGLRRQYRLRRARPPAHPRRGHRDAAAQSHPLALLRRRRCDAGRDRASDDGAEDRLARPRRFGRAAGRDRDAGAHAGVRRAAGDPAAGLGRCLRRSGAARAHDGGDDRRGRGDVRGQHARRRRGHAARRHRADHARRQGRARADQRHAVLDRLCARRPVRGAAARALGAGDGRARRSMRRWARRRRSGRRSRRCAAIAGRSRRRAR